MPDGDKAAVQTVREYLTKSRFRLGLECATKLYYADRPAYENKNLQDPFLNMLADGGIQVGALARVMYPAGVVVDATSPDAQLKQTAELLTLDEVTIFEATVCIDGFLARVDVLRKLGDDIDLIEVKASSYDSNKHSFVGKKGGVLADFKTHLRDVAFQVLVFERCHPRFRVRPFLMLADKTKRASVDGLNQCFRVSRTGSRAVVEIQPGTNSKTIGAPLLTVIDASEAVRLILQEPVQINGSEMSFADAAAVLRDTARRVERFAPRAGSICGSCEFRNEQNAASDALLSGFRECWHGAFGFTSADFAGGTVLDLWNFRAKDKLIADNVLKLSDVRAEHLKIREVEDGLSHGQRQWMQVSGEWIGGGPFYLDRDAVKAAAAQWQYPLHFIDFETAAVPIPYNAGLRPYGQLAFQFSHHVMYENGVVEHFSQFLEVTPGVYPNSDFLRALKQSLGGQGTIFRWAAHENTILRAIRGQLVERADPLPDQADLIDFIDAITDWDQNGARVEGPRCMVDLKEIAEKYFFHPATTGSSSLKKVLPAVLRSCEALQSMYGSPVYGQGSLIRSLNFSDPIAWWNASSTNCDPYALLPPIFSDVSAADNCLLNQDSELADGLAATVAYMRLQVEQLSDEMREQIKAALLRYCELDTLAMVMVVQAWLYWCKAPSVDHQ